MYGEKKGAACHPAVLSQAVVRPPDAQRDGTVRLADIEGRYNDEKAVAEEVVHRDGYVHDSPPGRRARVDRGRQPRPDRGAVRSSRHEQTRAPAATSARGIR